MRPGTVRALLSLCVFLAFVPAARAQFETASVVGTVRDPSGAVVPDAKVTLTNTATGVAVTRTTTPDGNYEFVTVKGGIYLVTAEKSSGSRSPSPTTSRCRSALDFAWTCSWRLDSSRRK